MDAVDKSDARRASCSPRRSTASDDTFRRDLAGADAASVEAFLAARGVPKELAHHLKLWFLAVSVAAAAMRGRRANRRGLPEVDEVDRRGRRGAQDPGRRAGERRRATRRARRRAAGSVGRAC